MKGIFKKIISPILVIASFFNITGVSFSVLAATNPLKGDLKYDVQYVTVNNQSVSVTSGNYTNPGDVEIRKTVTKLDDNGNYEVKFEARGVRYASQSVNTGPIYAVIVFDRSNSMADDTKWTNAVNAARLSASGLHLKYKNANIALVVFGTSARTTRGFSKGDFTGISDKELFGYQPYSSFDQTGGTNIHDGLIEADNLLSAQNIPANAKKYILLISDGSPTYYVNGTSIAGDGNFATDELLNATFNKADELKTTDKVEIFTVGYDLSDDKACAPGKCTDKYKDYTPATILQKIASNASHYHSSQVSNIISVINDIVDETVVYSPAATNLVIKDNLGSQFTSSADSDGDGVVELKLDSTTILDDTAYQEVGKFTITIDQNSETGWHKTNNNFSYTYNNSTTPIVCDQNPEAYWIKQKSSYSIEYYYNGQIDSTKTETGEKYPNEIVSVSNTAIQANLKSGYKLASVDPTSKQITIKSNAQNVIKVYYVTDENQTKDLSYTIEYYKDGKKVEADTETIKETVQVLKPDTLTVDKTKINIVDKYVGYKFQKTDPTEIPNTINNNGVIKVYYVTDESLVIIHYVVKAGDNYIPFTKYGRDEFGNKTTDFKDVELEDLVLTGKIGSEFKTIYREVPEYNLVGIYNGNILENTNLEILEGKSITDTFDLETKEYTYVYEAPIGDSEELPPQTGVEASNYINYLLLFIVIYIIKKYFGLINTK